MGSQPCLPGLPHAEDAAGASIMQQFKILAGALVTYPKPTGIVSMFRPDGTQPTPGGYTAGGTLVEAMGLEH